MTKRTYFTADEVRGLLLATEDQVDAALAACDRVEAVLERQAEQRRQRALGVDPARVIDGETVEAEQKEIEG